MGEQVKYFTLDDEYTVELPDVPTAPPHTTRSITAEMDHRALAALLVLVLVVLAFCAGLALG